MQRKSKPGDTIGKEMMGIGSHFALKMELVLLSMQSHGRSNFAVELSSRLFDQS